MTISATPINAERTSAMGWAWLMAPLSDRSRIPSKCGGSARAAKAWGQAERSYRQLSSEFFRAAFSRSSTWKRRLPTVRAGTRPLPRSIGRCSWQHPIERDLRNTEQHAGDGEGEQDGDQ